MSVGLYRHCSLGQVRRYIQNNKYTLQAKFDPKLTEEWAMRFGEFHNSYLKNHKTYFYLVPQQIYINNQYQVYSFQNFNNELTRVLIYDHYILTLQEELNFRIKNHQTFSQIQLWYFTYALVCAGLELVNIHEQYHPDNLQSLQINPDTILLNEFGYIKIQGYFSTPYQPKVHSSYKPNDNTKVTKQPFPHKIQSGASFSIGRILSALILLKKMDDFYDRQSKLFEQERFQKQLSQHEQRLGLLFNIVQGLLIQAPQTRILLSQVKALLLPYQDKILSLQEFQIEKQTSKQSMKILLNAQS